MRRQGDAPLRFACPCGRQVTSKYALKKHKLVCSGRPTETPAEKDAA
jgi:hypothetical protein